MKASFPRCVDKPNTYFLLFDIHGPERDSLFFAFVRGDKGLFTVSQFHPEDESVTSTACPRRVDNFRLPNPPSDFRILDLRLF